METLVFYAIAIEPIKVQNCSASKNDRLNLSFVKDTYGNVKKMARKGGKMVIYESQNFHNFYSYKTGKKWKRKF